MKTVLNAPDRNAGAAEEKTMEKSSTVSLDQKLWRSRYGFQIMIGLAVVIVSFLYGLGAGYSKKVAAAHAKPVPLEQYVDPSSPRISTRLPLPQGVKVSQIGRDVTINNRSADVLSFVSSRSVESLIEEQRNLWKSRGLMESGIAAKGRGVAIGFDSKNGTRYTTTVWEVPPTIRKAVSNGMPVQGMIVAVDSAESSAADGNPTGLSTESISQGEVPGIPTRPGGHGGAVFSSKDPSGRSFSGVYTNPGDIEENVAFYRETLGTSGWNEGQANFHGDQDSGVGDMLFAKDDYEASLVFAPSIAGNDGTEKTTVMVTLMPKSAMN